MYQLASKAHTFVNTYQNAEINISIKRSTYEIYNEYIKTKNIIYI